MKPQTKKKKILITLAVIAGIFLVATLVFLYAFNMLFRETTYTAEDFGITTVRSPMDYNGNGNDDYADIVLGARADAENHPVYNDAYYETAYPPENIGVCTDVVWRAFKQAGYCLKDMVDKDIAARPGAYPAAAKPDPNIDFRRVKNLHVFFKTYGITLTTDPDDISEWQPGDIVIFGDDRHIGIVSDKRNADGRTYIIHNGGQPKREEDYLKRSAAYITGHYRFDASLVPAELLVPWED